MGAGSLRVKQQKRIGQRSRPMVAVKSEPSRVFMFANTHDFPLDFLRHRMAPNEGFRPLSATFKSIERRQKTGTRETPKHLNRTANPLFPRFESGRRLCSVPGHCLASPGRHAAFDALEAWATRRFLTSVFLPPTPPKRLRVSFIPLREGGVADPLVGRLRNLALGRAEAPARWESVRQQFGARQELAALADLAPFNDDRGVRRVPHLAARAAVRGAEGLLHPSEDRRRTRTAGDPQRHAPEPHPWKGQNRPQTA